MRTQAAFNSFPKAATLTELSWCYDRPSSTYVPELLPCMLLQNASRLVSVKMMQLRGKQVLGCGDLGTLVHACPQLVDISIESMHIIGPAQSDHAGAVCQLSAGHRECCCIPGQADAPHLLDCWCQRILMSLLKYGFKHGRHPTQLDGSPVPTTRAAGPVNWQHPGSWGPMQHLSSCTALTSLCCDPAYLEDNHPSMPDLDLSGQIFIKSGLPASSIYQAGRWCH